VLTIDFSLCRAELLADQYRKKSTLYKTDVLLVPLGDDFRWETNKEITNQFDNYFRLIDYMNSHPEMKIHVSSDIVFTPAERQCVLRHSSPTGILEPPINEGTWRYSKVFTACTCGRCSFNFALQV
jgi:hypothetical protein